MTKQEIARKFGYHSTLMLEASAGESDTELHIESARVELAAAALRRYNRQQAFNDQCLVAMALTL